MKRLALVLVFILAAAVLAATVSYPARPTGGGPITRTAVWSFDETDIGDMNVPSDPIYGHVQRIVIEAEGTEASWNLALTDPHGISLFSLTGIATPSDPNSYAINYKAVDGNDYLGVPVHGPLTVELANVASHGELQTLTMSAAATSGTFTLSLGDETTTDLAYDAATATIEAALEALEGIGTDGVTVGGGTLASGSATTFTFRDTLRDVAMLVPDFSTLGRTAEVQTLTLGAAATAGTYTLTYGGETTEAIAYNANAATIKAALEALATVEENDIAVGGTVPSGGGPTTFTFLAGLGDVAMLAIDTTELTGPETAEFAETVKGVLATGTFAETTDYGSELTDITVTVYYLGNGN